MIQTEKNAPRTSKQKTIAKDWIGSQPSTRSVKPKLTEPEQPNFQPPMRKVGEEGEWAAALGMGTKSNNKLDCHIPTTLQAIHDGNIRSWNATSVTPAHLGCSRRTAEQWKKGGYSTLPQRLRLDSPWKTLPDFTFPSATQDGFTITGIIKRARNKQESQQDNHEWPTRINALICMAFTHRITESVAVLPGGETG